MNKNQKVFTARVIRRRRWLMGTWVLSLCLAAGLSSGVALVKADAARPARESIEWCDIWISHANETNLPRVLLIGDSIVRDYYPEVEKRLAGKAFVARLATSRFVADQAVPTGWQPGAEGPQGRRGRARATGGQRATAGQQRG